MCCVLCVPFPYIMFCPLSIRFLIQALPLPQNNNIVCISFNTTISLRYSCYSFPYVPDCTKYTKIIHMQTQTTQDLLINCNPCPLLCIFCPQACWDNYVAGRPLIHPTPNIVICFAPRVVWGTHVSAKGFHFVRIHTCITAYLPSGF